MHRAGITGLQVALILAESKTPKYEITIIAKDFPGSLRTEYTSPWLVCMVKFILTNRAGGDWRSVAGPLNKTEQQWDAATYRHWQKLTQSEDKDICGVKVC